MLSGYYMKGLEAAYTRETNAEVLFVKVFSEELLYGFRLVRRSNIFRHNS